MLDVAVVAARPRHKVGQPVLTCGEQNTAKEYMAGKFRPTLMVSSCSPEVLAKTSAVITHCLGRRSWQQHLVMSWDAFKVCMAEPLAVNVGLRCTEGPGASAMCSCRDLPAVQTTPLSWSDVPLQG